LITTTFSLFDPGNDRSFCLVELESQNAAKLLGSTQTEMSLRGGCVVIRQDTKEEIRPLH